MGLLDALKQVDINEGIEEFKNTKGAVLVDVRTPDEYHQGHIAGSKNVPLQQFTAITSVVEDKDTPLFVYCFSGARSRRAATAFQRLGYKNAVNIGGIASYNGKLEK